MTREEAIAAIIKTTQVLVYAVTSKRYDGVDGHTETFRIPKHVALNAMQDITDTEYEPNIVVSEDGSQVTIGIGWRPPLPETFSHFESNNGNF